MNDNQLNFFKENIIRKYCTRLDEEIVNPENKGTMKRKDELKRDKIAAKTKPKPIKGDTDDESRHRIATFIYIRNRKAGRDRKNTQARAKRKINKENKKKD